jgi:hypothetical protein
MAIVDERGRLFGRLNLLDAVLLVLLMGIVPLAYAAYALFREQPPRITSVTPDRVAQALEIRLTVKGENLRPYMRVSADNQQAVDFLFRSTTQVEAPFYNLPPGQYDIIIYDQAQERFRLPNALTVLPSALPATEIVAVGAFGNLDAAGAAKITPGMSLGDLGEVIAVGKPLPDLTNVFASPGLVGVPIANALRLPAVVRFRCYVRAQQGRPSCVVEDAVISPPALLVLPMGAEKIPFQVEQVRSPHPLEAVPIQIRLTGPPSVLSLIKAGDVDLGATTNELAAMATVTGAGPVRRQSDAVAEIDVRLMAQLQRVDGVWLYDAAPLRSGSAIHLLNKRYEARGVVIDVASAEKGAAAGR